MNRFKALCVIVAVMVLSLSANATIIPDPGIPDTVDMVYTVLPDASSNKLQVQVDLYVFHDIETLASMAVGFSWDNPNLQMDSAVASPLAISTFDFLRIFFARGEIDSTNAQRQFLFAGARMNSNGFVPIGNRQLIASYYFTLSQWNVNDSIVIDTAEFSHGTYMSFVTTDVEPYLPIWSGPKIGYDSPCCTGPTGNVDMDPNDLVDISDLNLLIDHLFINYPPLPCVDEADVNQDGKVDISDQTALIDFLFINYTPLADCP